MSNDSRASSDEISVLFRSAYSGLPFDGCIVCARPFASPNIAYGVYKTIVGRESVFEFAMCDTCQQAQNNEWMSAESRASLEQFVQEHEYAGPVIDVEDLSEGFLAAMIKRCTLCNRPRSSLHRYSLMGRFETEERSPPDDDPQPWWAVVICDHCESAMNECISQKTRDSWERFMETYYDFPPDCGKELPSPDLLLI